MPNKNRHSLPLFDADQLRVKLRSYDRTPFIDLVAVWLECHPSPEAIIEYAEKYPDRYVNALTMLGKLAGYTEKREVEWHGSLNVSQMSDSQLEDRLSAMAVELGLPPLKLEDLRRQERVD